MVNMQSITCPKCKSNQNVQIWETIDAVENPAAMNALIAGTLFIHTCNVCQFKAPIAHNSLYTNKAKHFAVYLNADGDDEKALEIMQTAVKNDPECDLNRRVVTNFNELREKVTIFENGLDDRIIELVKLFHVAAIHENNPSVHVAECYFTIVDDQWRVEIATAKGEGGVFEVKQDLYDDFKKNYHNTLANEEFTYKVDLAMAYKMYQKTNN